MCHNLVKAIIFYNFLSVPAFAESEFYEISLEDARCIHENSDKYIQNSGNPILIAPNYCPEYDIKKILSGEVENCRGVSCPGSGSIGIIRISSEDLYCFSKMELDESINPYLIPKKDGWCQ